jgi:uncharacterized membrane protein YjgN (DUF898 family)
MQRKIQFTGTGGGLFIRFLGGMLLTVVTLGLGYPWFVVMLWKYIIKNISLETETGPVKFEFRGSGGGLFATFIVGYLLTVITFGIYGPWFECKLIKFLYNNSAGTTAEGKEYQLKFTGTGGELFCTILVGYLLTAVTCGIYGAWFMCKLQRFYTKNITIQHGQEQVGKFDFVGTGGKLLVTFLVGYLLTIVTFGIYGFWFIVKLWKFFAQNTEVTVNGKTYVEDFLGTGGQLLVTLLVGYLLTVITFGIYGPWFLCKLYKFELENLVFNDQ